MYQLKLTREAYNTVFNIVKTAETDILNCNIENRAIEEQLKKIYIRMHNQMLTSYKNNLQLKLNFTEGWALNEMFKLVTEIGPYEKTIIAEIIAELNKKSQPLFSERLQNYLQLC